ncbi:MAG: YceI family protein [Bacteroidia bacterium]|nr:YceI family protein [Bacteroidia bacterium]
MKNLLVFPLLFFSLSLFAFRVLTLWKINTENSSVNFTIKNAGINTEGSFTGLKGSIDFDPQNPAAGKISASVEAASINTGINMRDNDLRSEHYLDVKNYPLIKFVSTQITKTAQGYSVTGTFTIKKVSKTVTIPFTFENKVFKGTFTVNRLDYEVGKRNWVMGDDVKITFQIAVEN